MLTPQSLPWIEPLELADRIDEPYWVLLYSGVQAGYSGRYSYLACSLAERLEGDDFPPLESKLTANRAPFDNAWFGYLGYGLKDSLEVLTPDRPSRLTLPKLCMMWFDVIYQFDHVERTVTCFSRHGPDSAGILGPSRLDRLRICKANPGDDEVSSFHSNMTDAAYLEKAAHIIECIHRGDLYQANLTRKFFGSFSETPDYFVLFKKLCAVSPAPYSAFLRLGDSYILSSSPELFLHIDKDGHMRTRPIKGTAPRFADKEKDRQSRDALAASEKDRAENLMIADLMRNDLSRCCTPGSVCTESLFDITTHATIHHMSSTITGMKRGNCSTLDAVKACFPPGSMTGAPKIMAMNLCSRMEELERGIYSGAIGWFGGDGSCELSVVIRTLIMRGKEFEFQAGGGIVADSMPEGELQEIREKSRGILMALEIATPQF